MKLPPQVQTALERLERAGFEAVLVGGAVRDYVRDGRPAHDWDIATSALPEEVKAVFAGEPVIETGIQHGTVTVLLERVPLELTTYRVDGGYTDHRRPDCVRFARSLREDVARRDFTMNALAYHPRVGVIDLVGGREDIEKGLVRCVGEPNRRFQEDALRMLRGLRFASVYGLRLEAETAAAIHRNRELLRGIAAERIQEELTKLFCGAGAGEILRDFVDVLGVPIPELAALVGFEQHNPHHDKDIWEHTAAVVAAIQAEPVLRWAALLHDVGKPDCFSLGEDGVGHFYGHAAHSAELANTILHRLRLDNERRERIVRLVRYHDMPFTAERRVVKRLLNKHGEEAARQLIELHRADTLGQSALCQPRLAVFEEMLEQINTLLEEKTCFSLRDLAIRGQDVMALGLQGREIGQALRDCLEAVLEERLPNERDALLAFLQTRRGIRDGLPGKGLQ